MSIGLVAASYSIVANDAIQTLGTFLSSNSKRPWWVLWLFACSILGVVILYSWINYSGDVSYGRLSSKFPVPETFTWIHVIPPIAIIFLTRKGIPVSTTFLVLTVFAPTQLSSMLTKSLLGYLVAFISSIFIYLLCAKVIEQKFLKLDDGPIKNQWVFLQWVSTGFLWSQWLIQDLANIFVYMPTRSLSPVWLIYSLSILFILHAIIIYRRGGEIQGIVTSKTGTSDIRSATIIDFIYAIILFIFKGMSNIPMSTTWVFLGLLAGRELGLLIRLKNRPFKNVVTLVFKDMGKAGIGLGISVLLALGLPWLSSIA